MQVVITSLQFIRAEAAAVSVAGPGLLCGVEANVGSGGFSGDERLGN